MANFKTFKAEQDFVNQYLKEIRDYTMLDKNEERVLLKQYKDTQDNNILNKIVKANLRFVVSVAVKYQNQGLSMPELINEGNIGLIESIKRFNVDTYSVKFISYAVWWIRQAIIKALYEKSRLVRVSAEKESKLKSVNKYAELSLQKYGFINYEYVSKKSNCKPKDVEQILSLSNNRLSMDSSASEDSESNLYDVMIDDKAESPDDFLNDRALRKKISLMLEKLNKKEKQVITFYYGIGCETSFNLEQIGSKMNISKERVRQIKNKALEKLKKEYTSLSDDIYDFANCA